MKTCLILSLMLSLLAFGAGRPAHVSGGATTTDAPAEQQQQNGVPPTPVVGVCDCQGFTVSAVRTRDSQGRCVYRLMISQLHPAGGHVPKGIRLTFTSPVTFNAVTPGPLVTGATQTPANAANATSVEWFFNTAATLPNSSTPQWLADIVVNSNGVSPQQLLVEWLDEDHIVMCRATLTLQCPCKTVQATAGDDDLCIGQTTNITLAPPPAAGAQIVWYKANAPCPPPVPPTGTPPAGWQVAQVGGISYNTNVISQSTCYQAVITESGSCAYTSSLTTVNVSQVPSLAGLTAAPTVFCQTGSSTFSLINPFTTAFPNQVFWEFWNGTAWTQVATNVQTYTTPQLTAINPQDCLFRLYQYRVRVGNTACGVLTSPLDIRVDHVSEAQNLTANPAGPLCYDQATKLTLQTCGQVTLWEQSTDGGVTWTTIAGAAPTKNYFTPELLQTTKFRVTVKNGSCGPVNQSIDVQVKPKLAVSLAANTNVLCPGPVTLTATPSYTAGVTYTWFRNGQLMSPPTTTTPTRPITQPGNYSVVVNDPACGTAQSNVITIYPPPVVSVSGPCAVCQGGSVTLTANVAGGDPACQYNFNWSAPGWTATGVTVTPPLPAPNSSMTYTVAATCGSCIAVGTHTITRCPTVP